MENANVTEVIREQDTYRRAFETIMDYLRGYTQYHNDGTVVLDLLEHVNQLHEHDDNSDVFMLIYNGTDLDGNETTDIYRNIQNPE